MVEPLYSARILIVALEVQYRVRILNRQVNMQYGLWIGTIEVLYRVRILHSFTVEV